MLHSAFLYSRYRILILLAKNCHDIRALLSTLGSCFRLPCLQIVIATDHIVKSFKCIINTFPIFWVRSIYILIPFHFVIFVPFIFHLLSYVFLRLKMFAAITFQYLSPNIRPSYPDILLAVSLCFSLFSHTLPHVPSPPPPPSPSSFPPSSSSPFPPQTRKRLAIVEARFLTSFTSLGRERSCLCRDLPEGQTIHRHSRGRSRDHAGQLCEKVC